MSRDLVSHFFLYTRPLNITLLSRFFPYIIYTNEYRSLIGFLLIYKTIWFRSLIPLLLLGPSDENYWEPIGERKISTSNKRHILDDAEFFIFRRYSSWTLKRRTQAKVVWALNLNVL